MNQFFKSSVTVTVFFAAISACLFFAFSFLYSMFSGTAVYLKYLSEGAYSITISQQSEDDAFTTGDMSNFINTHGYMTVVKAQSFRSGLEIYKPKGFSSHSKLKSGRIFEDTEIVNGNAVALISADKLSDCISDGDGYRYIIDGCSFEVIGTLEKSNIDSIVPLMCVLNTTPDYMVGGTFFIYDSENTAGLAEELRDAVLSINDNANVSVSVVDAGLFKNGLLPDIKIIIIVITAILLLMALNLYSINSYWFDGKKREYFVYKLCGLSDIVIYLRLFANYITLVFIGSVTGIVISAVFVLSFSFILETPPLTYYLSTILIDAAISMFGIFYFSVKLQKMMREG